MLSFALEMASYLFEFNNSLNFFKQGNIMLITFFKCKLYNVFVVSGSFFTFLLSLFYLLNGVEAFISIIGFGTISI